MLRTLPPLILFLSCNYFSLPSPPEPIRESKEVFPDEPSKVLINLKNSLEIFYDKGIYLNCYSEDFVFQPDRSLPYPINSPWGKEEESRIITNLISSLDFSVSKPSRVSYAVLYSSVYSDSAFMDVSFEFVFVFKNLGETLARSRAKLYFVRNWDGRRAIRYWEDGKVDTTSFAELKFSFR
ncbi:MAG: hypothetical protein ACO2O5_08510 [Candidatus Caldipriscus sp.]